jgi:hypothetical protein
MGTVALQIKVSGGDKLLKLKGLSGAKTYMKKAIGKMTLAVEASSKPITPIDKGFLRNSTFSHTSGLKGFVVNTAPYAQFVHEGTAKWPLAKPPRNKNTVRQFLKVGGERAKPQIERILQNMFHEITSRLTR